MQAEIKEENIQAGLESLLSLVTELSLTLKEHRYIFGREAFLCGYTVFCLIPFFSICSRSRDGSFS